MAGGYVQVDDYPKPQIIRSSRGGGWDRRLTLR